MSPGARGAVLIVVAALLSFLALRGAAENTQIPVVTGSEAVPTVDASDTETDGEEFGDEATDPVGVAPTTTVDLSTARPNSEVVVLVANGSGVNGQAGRLTSQLRNQGFQTQEPKNADPQAVSTIYYRPGFAVEAAVVRSVLGGTTTVTPLDTPDPNIGEGIDLAPVNVLVLVGADDLADG